MYIYNTLHTSNFNKTSNTQIQVTTKTFPPIRDYYYYNIMSIKFNHLNQFPIQNFTMNLNNIQLTLLVLGLFEFMLLHILLDKKRIFNFFKGFQSSIQSHDQSKTKNATLSLSSSIKQENKAHQSINREETELVLKSLGLFSDSEEKKLPEELGADEIASIFDAKSPSLDEVKEAFDVFDKNGDGFIDAGELQSVLCALGFNKEGSAMEDCKRMIVAFDENGDEVIDFEEFVKFMEN